MESFCSCNWCVCSVIDNEAEWSRWGLERADVLHATVARRALMIRASRVKVSAENEAVPLLSVLPSGVREGDRGWWGCAWGWQAVDETGTIILPNCVSAQAFLPAASLCPFSAHSWPFILSSCPFLMLVPKSGKAARHDKPPPPDQTHIHTHPCVHHPSISPFSLLLHPQTPEAVDTITLWSSVKHVDPFEDYLSDCLLWLSDNVAFCGSPVCNLSARRLFCCSAGVVCFCVRLCLLFPLWSVWFCPKGENGDALHHFPLIKLPGTWTDTYNDRQQFAFYQFCLM